MFEGNEFNGEVAPAIADLDASGTVRIIDLAFVTKDAEGETAVIEIEDAAVASAFDQISDGQFDLLNDEDLDGLAADLEPGTSALIVVWREPLAGPRGPQPSADRAARSSPCSESRVKSCWRPSRP